MDIDIDQADPRNDLIKENQDGKYIFKVDKDKFEIDRFNRVFDQYIDRRKEEMKKRMEQRLNELNKPVDPPPIYNLPLGEILIKTKDSMLNMLDDLLRFRFNLDTFTKNNRLFHIGVLTIIIGLVIYLYAVLSDSDSSNGIKYNNRIIVEQYSVKN